MDKKDELQKKMIELQELLSTDCDKVNSYFWFAVKCCVVVVKYFHLSTSKYLRL